MKKKSIAIKAGIILMLVSIPFFLAIPVVPFLEISKKAQISLGLLITGEILFWAGGLLLGKELFTRYKSYLNPKNWFKGNKS